MYTLRHNSGNFQKLPNFANIIWKRGRMSKQVFWDFFYEKFAFCSLFSIIGSSRIGWWNGRCSGGGMVDVRTVGTCDSKPYSRERASVKRCDIREGYTYNTWKFVEICSGGGMVDTYVSDAYALWVCGFKSHLEHQFNNSKWRIQNSKLSKMFHNFEFLILNLAFQRFAQVMDW